MNSLVVPHLLFIRKELCESLKNQPFEAKCEATKGLRNITTTSPAEYLLRKKNDY